MAFLVKRSDYWAMQSLRGEKKDLQDNIIQVDKELYHILTDKLLKLDRRVDESQTFDQIQGNRHSLHKLLESILANLLKHKLFDDFICGIISRLVYFKWNERAYPSSVTEIIMEITSGGFRGMVLAHGPKSNNNSNYGIGIISDSDYWKLWLLSFKGLDPATQRMVLMHFKLAAQNGDGFQYMHRDTEETRIKYGGQPEKVVLDITCSGCIGSPAVMDTIDFIQKHLTDAGHQRVKCTNCGASAFYDVSLPAQRD